MKKYSTRIMAVCPHTGDITRYEGPFVEAANPEAARKILDENGLGYCHVDDEVVAVVPVDMKTMTRGVWIDLDRHN